MRESNMSCDNSREINIWRIIIRIEIYIYIIEKYNGFLDCGSLVHYQHYHINALWVAKFIILRWNVMSLYCWSNFLYPPEMKFGGVYRFHPVRPVCLSVLRLWTWFCPRMSYKMGVWIFLKICTLMKGHRRR